MQMHPLIFLYYYIVYAFSEIPKSSCANSATQYSYPAKIGTHNLNPKTEFKSDDPFKVAQEIKWLEPLIPYTPMC